MGLQLLHFFLQLGHVVAGQEALLRFTPLDVVAIDGMVAHLWLDHASFERDELVGTDTFSAVFEQVVHLCQWSHFEIGVLACRIELAAYLAGSTRTILLDDLDVRKDGLVRCLSGSLAFVEVQGRVGVTRLGPLPVEV